MDLGAPLSHLIFLISVRDVIFLDELSNVVASIASRVGSRKMLD